MTAKVMKCIEACQHPNADALRVYKFSDEMKPSKTISIVANMENVYEVGDSAEIVFANSVMISGEKIGSAKIRGIRSQGMALGKTDLPVGSDVTELHCRVQEGFVFGGWPSIGSLFNVRKDLSNAGELREVDYRGKVKLDGCNSGIQVHPDGSICAQSRTQLLLDGVDNQGFAKWVKERKDTFVNMNQNYSFTIFGEWCGPGIQKRTAVSSIPEKVFAIFAIQASEPGETYLVQDPQTIEHLLRGVGPASISMDKLNELGIYVLPWSTELIKLNYEDKDLLEKQVESINDIVSDVEVCDPWVKKNFGVEGLGEGVVMYPILGGGGSAIDREDFSELVFKAKGEKHKVVKTKKSVQVDPEVAASIDEFVTLFCTENRLEQIAEKVGPFDQKLTGSFIKEFNIDVQKESVAELEASGLEWRYVAKAVGTTARLWWAAKTKEQAMK